MSRMKWSDSKGLLGPCALRRLRAGRIQEWLLHMLTRLGHGVDQQLVHSQGGQFAVADSLSS